MLAARIESIILLEEVPADDVYKHDGAVMAEAVHVEMFVDCMNRAREKGKAGDK